MNVHPPILGDSPCVIEDYLGAQGAIKTNTVWSGSRAEFWAYRDSIPALAGHDIVTHHSQHYPRRCNDITLSGAALSFETRRDADSNHACIPLVLVSWWPEANTAIPKQATVV